MVSDTTEHPFWGEVIPQGWAPKMSTTHSRIQIDRVKGSPHPLKIETVSSF